MTGSPTLRDWGFLILLGLIWGASFLGVSLALQSFGPLTVAAGRIALGAIVLTSIAFATGRGLPDHTTPTGRRIWLHCIGFAIFTNSLPFALLSWAQQQVTSGFAGITMAVVPLFVLPLAWLVLKEPLSLRKLVGFLFGFAGVIVLIGPEALTASGQDGENLARLGCVGAALCYAIGTIITRTAPKGPMISYSAAGLLIGSLIIVPVSLAAEGLPSLGQPTALISLVYLGLFPTALATVLLVQVINSAGPTFLVLVNYQVPVWAVIFGMLALGEALPASFAVALLLILIGLAISQNRRRRPAT